MKNIRLLEKTYFALLIIIFVTIFVSPFIVRADLFAVGEEALEVMLIISLFAALYVILRLYRNEMVKNLAEMEEIDKDRHNLKTRLDEAFKYIGAVNVQIQEIKSTIFGIKKFPENKKDISQILEFFSEKILSIINVDWVIVRIVDKKKSVVLREHRSQRVGKDFAKCKIGGGAEPRGNGLDDCKVIESSQENFHIKAYCILPCERICKECQQEVLIKAIINQLEMLFIIFSTHYKDNEVEHKKKLA